MREVFRELALPVYLPAALVAAGQLAVAMLLPLYVLALGGHAAAASALAGVSGLGSLLANVPAGLLVARYGDRAVMRGALGLGTVAGVGMAFANTPWLLAPCTFLFGASGGAWLLARLAFMSDAAPAAQRGRAIALMGGMQRLGGFVGPVTGGALADAFGFPTAFAVAAAIVAVGYLLVTRHVRVASAHAQVTGAGSVLAAAASPSAAAASDAFAQAAPGPAHDRPAGALARQWQVVREHRGVFATAGSAIVAIALVRIGFSLLIPLWGAHIGLDTVRIGLTMSVLSGIDMLLFYPTGAVMDRFGRKWAGVPCLLGIAAALGMLPACTDFAHLAAVALVCGFANGLGSGIVMTLGSDLAPPDQRGEFLGVWRSLSDLGGLGAPFLTSVLAATVGLAGACFAAAGVGVLGALVLAFAFAEPRRDP